jgi:hypothetical protein
MSLNPTQSATFRVHIENLAFNVNKWTLVQLLQWSCGLNSPPDLQMVRTAHGRQTGYCSCIFALKTREEMLHCIEKLNALPYASLVCVLGPNRASLQAKEAYMPGAKRIKHAFSESSYEEVQPAPAIISALCVVINVLNECVSCLYIEGWFVTYPMRSHHHGRNLRFDN